MIRRPYTPWLLLACVASLAACSQSGSGSSTPAVAAPAPSTGAPAAFTSQAAPEGAKVFFVDLKDGAEVSSPLTVKFGVSGIDIAPAGQDQPHSGHHHLIVDADLPPANAPIPADAHHLHFGKGQTEATIELSPGKHTLQLCFADYRHVPFNPPIVSDKITVTVK